MSAAEEGREKGDSGRCHQDGYTPVDSCIAE